MIYEVKSRVLLESPKLGNVINHTLGSENPTVAVLVRLRMPHRKPINRDGLLLVG